MLLSYSPLSFFRDSQCCCCVLKTLCYFTVKDGHCCRVEDLRPFLGQTHDPRASLVALLVLMSSTSRRWIA